MAGANNKQKELADLPIGPVLAITPAGCGRTEALAMRARAAIERGDVAAPRKELAITFSTKARTNLATRMRTCVGPRWRTRITDSNLHGLGARILKAHGELVGIPGDIELPENRWRRRQRRVLGVDYTNQAPFEQALTYAKDGAFDDDEVWVRLTEVGHPKALEYEQALRDEGRLDHDDVLRHAARLLAIDDVKTLYRQHFGLVLVDEVQDLSMVQYDIIRAVGGGRITYAGDPAQGICSFAGAQPDLVFAAIQAQHPEEVELDVSYRSSPAVLGAVNALAGVMGTTQLECASPGDWGAGGEVVGFEYPDPDAEAAALVAIMTDLLEDPQLTIGVVFRRDGLRSAAFRRQAADAGIAFEDWSLATHRPATVALLKRRQAQDLKAGETDSERLEELERLCREDLADADADVIDDLAAAIEQLEDVQAEGATLEEALAGCRESSTPDAAVSPGIHLLTGHKGKGQEFDWVFVLGLEKGLVPDFRNEGPGEVEEEPAAAA